jgi:UDP-N-acetylmuramoyl-L-alanyl-D-glutamate--2,6-diaminopimelate ligase
MSSTLAQLADLGVKLTGITADSRRVEPGSLFLAYPGERNDGRQFIPQSVAKGVAAVLWESADFKWNNVWQLPNLPVAGLREKAGHIADEFYGHPSSALLSIGITGTNGKTSCCHWLAKALTQLGRKAAAIGTLGNGFPGALSPALNTTPDPVQLHGMLAEYLQQNATAVAMEVSSHGLSQGRVNGMRFDVAVFTNLTRDHLDYHGDMDAYAAAKRQLFDWPGLKHAVINADDEYGAQLAAELCSSNLKVWDYGLQAGTVRARNLELDNNGLTMDVITPAGEVCLEAPLLLGRFNAYNLLAVLATLLASGIALQDAARTLRNVEPVAGRMQRLGGGKVPLVVIDYAHTPDALEKVLQALREQTRGVLTCVFGCGGNRDKGKRPLMGEVVSSLADRAIVTSDNPRREDPAAIIAEVIAGMRGNYQIEVDRACAIQEAIASSSSGDVVLIAGKGHEDYQEIGNNKLPFSDAEVALRVLEAAA